MPKHVLEPALTSGNFASAYSVSTPPDQIVTSGPLRLAQYVPGEKTVLGRNPHWFGFDQSRKRLPYLNEVVFLVVPDQDAADLKFRSGEIDGLDNMKPENYRWYQDNQQKANFTLYDLGPEINSNYFWFNLNKVQKATAGKDDWRSVRQSCEVRVVQQPCLSPGRVDGRRSRCDDSQRLLRRRPEELVAGRARQQGWHNPDIVNYDYNPAESRKLLASLGFKDAQRRRVSGRHARERDQFYDEDEQRQQLRVGTANFIKDDLAKVGIRMTLAPVDFNTLITNLRNDFQYDSILLGLQSGVPPDPGNGQNVTGRPASRIISSRAS